jgi:hypothetical protein
LIVTQLPEDVGKHEGHQCSTSRREQALEEHVNRFNQRIREMEENLDSSKILFPLLKNQFGESQGSLTTVC